MRLFPGSFRDPAVEARFAAGRAGAQVGRVAAGLALHVAAVTLQWKDVVSPEYQYDFAALGAPELEAGARVMAAILVVHWVASVMLSLGLAGCLLLPPRRRRVRAAPDSDGGPTAWARTAGGVGDRGSAAWACGAFDAVTLAHVGVSLAGYAWFPGERWAVTFPAEMLFLHGWMATVPFRCVRRAA